MFSAPGIISQPEPSSLTVSYKSDEPEDADMKDRKIISSVLCGVGITEVHLLQRVVEVCHKYKLIKGDSCNLRTGFDLSDPTVQQQVSRRIIETNAMLVILSPPCTKLSALQALNLHINGPEWAAAFAVERDKSRTLSTG